jgi:ADP-ribosylglycohydrolase
MDERQHFYGAAFGDTAGSIYEFENRKTDRPEEIQLLDNPLCHFTDDTVLTAAIAEAARTDRDYKKALHKWANRYPNAGYAGMFYRWAMSKYPPQPYNSFGNGSAMRVSAVGWMFDTEEEVLREAKRSAEPTHNHPEGIKGAQSVALAIFLCRKGASKEQVKERIERKFGYDLSRTLADIRPDYTFDVTCQGAVPVAFIAFLESRDFVSAIQNAISVGGDSDTIAAIAGSIAEACYGLGCVELPSDYLPADIRDALKIGG